MQAAALLPQLDRLAEWNARRAESVRLIRDGLRDLPGLRPFVNGGAGSPVYYKLGFQYDAAAFGRGHSHAIGARADIWRSRRLHRSRVDPTLPSAANFCCDAQHGIATTMW